MPHLLATFSPSALARYGGASRDKVPGGKVEINPIAGNVSSVPGNVDEIYVTRGRRIRNPEHFQELK